MMPCAWPAPTPCRCENNLHASFQSRRRNTRWNTSSFSRRQDRLDRKTIKMHMGATHYLMKTPPKVATETALCLLIYNLTQVLNVMGVEKLMKAIKA